LKREGNKAGGREKTEGSQRIDGVPEKQRKKHEKKEQKGGSWGCIKQKGKTPRGKAKGGGLLESNIMKRCKGGGGGAKGKRKSEKKGSGWIFQGGPWERAKTHWVRTRGEKVS